MVLLKIQVTAIFVKTVLRKMNNESSVPVVKSQIAFILFCHLHSPKYL